MSKLTYDTKINSRPVTDRTRQICAEDLNEVKESVNDLYDDKANLSGDTFTGTVKAPIFDTNIPAAKLTMSGTTIQASGTDANIDINLTTKGTGAVIMSNVDISGGRISNVIYEDNFESIIDPSENEATSTTIIDQFEGVLITLSQVGNDQILQLPTSANIRKFTVVNNDTSTHSIDVNTKTLQPGKGQTWLFDGTNWIEIDVGIREIPVIATQGGTGFSSYTVGDMLYANTATSLSRLASVASGQILISQGVGIAPIWSSSASVSTIYSTTFDTNVATAKLTMSGTSIQALGTDSNIDINLTPKGTGSAVISKVDINGGTIDGTTISNSNITVGNGNILNVSNGILYLANGQITANKLQTTATDLGESHINLNFSNSNPGFYTNLTINGSFSAGSINALTLTPQTTGFTINGGTTPKTLTVSDDTNISGTNTGDVTLATDNGLSLTNQVLAIGTPSTINSSSTNLVSGSSHTHELRGIKLPNRKYIGVNCDFTTISEAVTWFNASATTDTEFILDAGIHLVTDTITINNSNAKLRLDGAGYNITYINASTGLATKPMFVLNTRCDFIDLTLNASSLASYGTVSGENGINVAFSSANYSEFKNCSFNSFNIGIKITSNAQIIQSNGVFVNCVAKAIEINTATACSYRIQDSTIFDGNATAIDLLQCSNLSFAVINAKFIIPTGGYGISYTRANITYTNLIIFGNVHSNVGTGTFINGFDFTNSADANIEIINNIGVEDKSPHAKINSWNNSASTTITTAGTFYKDNFVNTSVYTCKFTIANNQATYQSNHVRDLMFFISGSSSCTNQANRTAQYILIKNGQTGTHYGETIVRLVATGSYSSFSFNAYIPNININDSIELYVTSSNNGDIILTNDVNILITTR